MGQAKTGKNNNLDNVTGTTGSNVISSSVKTGKQRIMHKTTGELPEKSGYAKASPNFKQIDPDEKILASEDAQKQAIKDNTIEGGQESDESKDDDVDHS